MNITINIQAPELANAILSLAAALSGKQLVAGAAEQAATQTQPAPQAQQPAQQSANVVPFQQQQAPTAVPTAPIQQPVQQQMPAPQSQPVVPTSTPGYTMDQLAVAATQLMDAGRQQELLSLLSSFGVPSLMALPKEQYGNFATQLRGMGAKL